MIVRDESPVISRCLKSVKPIIDYWVIVDTGSLDGTQEIIRNEMRDIPGELHERPWVDFSHNRGEALSLAKGKGDFALLIDADEQVILEKGFQMPELTEDIYLVDVNLGLLAAYRELLINNHLEWYWEGVLHEQILCRTPLEKFSTLKGIRNFSLPDGNRSLDADKFHKDLDVLKKGLQKEPNNSRYVFYIAQTLAALGQFQEALEYYERRSNMGGWHQEIYQSLYRIGFMQEMLSSNRHTIIQSYAKAYEYMPLRAEPVFRISYQYYCLGQFAEAKRIADIGMKIPFPNPEAAFYIEPTIYQSWLLKLYADCCFDLGEAREANEAYRKIAENSSLSEEAQQEIRSNLILMNNQYSLKENIIPRRIQF